MVKKKDEVIDTEKILIDISENQVKIIESLKRIETKMLSVKSSLI